MVILIRKAVRSIWKNKRTYGACILLIALGVATYVGFLGAHGDLSRSVEQLYSSQRFGDAFALATGVPESVVRKLEQAAGVEEVTARVATEVKLIRRDESTALNLQLISYDKSQLDGLNQFLLEDGELPGRGEILLGRLFCQVHGYEIGDRLLLVSDQGQAYVTISGIVSSPEFISRMEAEELFGGYGFMPLSELNRLKDNSGLYDNLVFHLSTSASFMQIEENLSEILQPWGLQQLYERKDHADYAAVKTSIDSLKNSGSLISYLFIAVSVMVLYILLRRIIRQERTQIGTLKAFGFSGVSILALYTGYGVVVGALGATVGSLLGFLLSGWAADMFYMIFQLEPAAAAIPFELLGQAFAISVTAGASAAFLAAKSLLRLGAAEAMRPPAPTSSRKRKAGEPSGWRARRVRSLVFPVWLGMVARSIARGRGRSLFVIAGLAVSFTILVFMSSYSGLMEEISMTQYEQIELFDVKAVLKEPVLYEEALSAAHQVKGVEHGEAALSLNVTVYHANREADNVVLLGLAEHGKLYRIFDSRNMTVRPLPPDGLAVNEALAGKLGLAVGDVVSVTTPYTGQRRLKMQIASVEAVNFGYQAYMEIGQLCSYLETSEIADTILLKTDDPESAIAYLEHGSNVAFASNQQDLMKVQQSVMEQTNGANVAIFAVMGLGIAFAVIISTASISLSERAREYATLLVLGMGTLEVSWIMAAEYIFLTAIAFLPGIPLATALRLLLLSSLSEEPVITSARIALVHYFTGGAICLAVAFFANLLSVKQISRLELTEALKERE